MRKTCAICGEEFELLPKKPGLATYCPACSAAPPLLPKEARKAAEWREQENRQKAFHNVIALKREAQKTGQRDLAADLERDIVALGQLQIKPRGSSGEA